MTWQLHAILLPLCFAVGTLVGSFVNVCVYRIPWQKSVIWPPSTCPACLSPIAPRDNVPILGWLWLRGKCRACGAPIAARYPLIELLVGLLFAGLYVVDVAAVPQVIYQGELGVSLARLLYHAVLTTLLVIATFIDYDLEIIPDEVTLPGMALGVGLGTLWPWVRLEPAAASGWAAGLWVGVLGLLVGGGVILAVRAFSFVLFRKEGMGLGDVTLVAMIGSFLGWQVVPLTLFLGSFLGLAHSAWRLLVIVYQWLTGKPRLNTAIPFGPYLSMAAFVLMVGWRWLWPTWLAPAYEVFAEVPWLFRSYFGWS